MILELGLLCNVYLVYLLLRSYAQPVIPNQEKDYHLTTRRLSRVLQNRITNQVLLTQLVYLSYWWMTSVGLSNNSVETYYLEIYLFDGQVLLSNNTLFYLLIVNIFGYLSYQVCMNGQGSNLAIEGGFINNTFNNINNNTSGLLAGETSLMIQGNLIGINLLLSSNNLILALISWEQINICIYSLISINNNKTKVLSNSIKYFIISAVSTTIFIQGITLIYMETGSFNYSHINYQINMDPYIGLDNNLQQQGTLAIYFTVLQKQGGAPLHFWAPDLYSSQPSNITQWLQIVPKQGNLLLLLNFFNLFNNPYILNSVNSIDYSYSQGNVFIIQVGVFSMIVGSVSLLSQIKIKRFFAYSSICHVGFQLLCLGFNGYNAYIHYLIIYAQSTLSIFIIISLYNHNSLSFLQISYMNLKSSPLRTKLLGSALFMIFSINLFSLAGMPPQAGFFAKQGVQGTILSDVSSNTHNFVPGIFIILLFILASIISGYNYQRVIGLQLNIGNSNNPENLIITKDGHSVNNASPIFIIGGSSVLYDQLSVVTILQIIYIIQ